MTKKFDVLGVKVSRLNLELAHQNIQQWITERTKVYVCVVPVSTVVECVENKNYRDVVNAAQMVTPDGMPIVWLARLKGYSEVSRTYGPDLMRLLFHSGLKEGYRHYLYGGSVETLAQLESRLKNQFPGIKIMGSFSPPFAKECRDADPKLLEEINRLKPDILWVGLGAPKQDFWMQRHRPKLDVPVMIGVGAAFDFLAGTKRQAPLWMRRCGLEWFFRLCSEPRRLWKRYLIGNAKFIYFLIRDIFTTKAARN